MNKGQVLRHSPKKGSRINSGQASLVMILLVAMAFIFYAVELNWSKLADFKISTWTAASTSASVVASNFASYGERVLNESLLQSEELDFSYNGGEIKGCQDNMNWLKIIVAIVVLIIVAFTQQWYLLAFMAAMYTAAFIIEYSYITPTQMAMWNKLQRNLQPIDQYREAGIQTGMQSMVSDTTALPDRFDMNGNGKWGFINTSLDPKKVGKPRDTINRFSLFYTERLKLIGNKQKYYTVGDNTASNYNDFLTAFSNFIYNPSVDPKPGLGHAPFCGSANDGIVTRDRLIQAGVDDVKAFNLLLTYGAPPTPWATLENPTRIKLRPDLNFYNAPTVDAIRIQALAPAVGMSLNQFNKLLPIMQQAQARDASSPLCNPKCTHGTNTSQHSYDLGWTGTVASDGNKYFIPDECLSCANIPFGPNEYSPCPTFSKDVPYDATSVPYFTNWDPYKFRLIYSPSLEDPNFVDSLNLANPSNAFRVRLGHDDEMGKNLGNTNDPVEDTYQVTRATGLVFPMLNAMNNLLPGHDVSNDLYAALTSAGMVIPAGFPRYPDSVSKMSVTALSTDCAISGSNNDSKNGIFWKKGADQFCSGDVKNDAYKRLMPDGVTLDTEFKYYKDPTVWGPRTFDVGFQTSATPTIKNNVAQHWPYWDCTYMHSTTGATAGDRIPCAQGANAARLWPQDRLDTLVYGLEGLIELNSNLKNISINQLNLGVNQWYPQAARYFAPRCKAGTNYSFPNLDGSALVGILNVQQAPGAAKPFWEDPAVCNPGEQGLMIQWWYDLLNWHEKLFTWINTATPVLATDVCQGGTPDPLSPTGPVQCLQAKSKYFTDLDKCVNGVAGDLVNNPVFPLAAPFNLSNFCQKAVDEGFTFGITNFMITPLVASFPKPTPVGGPYNPYLVSTPAMYNALKKWIYTEWAVQKKLSERYTQLNVLTNGTVNVMNLFKEGSDNFYNFLTPPAPGVSNAYTLMKSRQQQGQSNTVVTNGSYKIKDLPGFAIYGWKDNQTRYIDNIKHEEGFWHLVRMEVKQPQTLASIFADQEGGFFGENCYTFKDGEGDVYTRATRWDESKTSRVPSKFANKKPIWNFNFSSGGVIVSGSNACKGLEDRAASDGPASAAASAVFDIYGGRDAGQMLNMYCADKHIGLSAAVFAGLGLPQTCNGDNSTCVYSLGIAGPRTAEDTANEKRYYENAFMFNFDPAEKTPNDTDALACWCLSNMILGAGVSSYGSAHFWVPPAGGNKYHVRIKFNDPNYGKKQDEGFKGKSLAETVDEDVEKPTPP